MAFCHCSRVPSSSGDPADGEECDGERISCLLEMLASVEDPRKPKGRQYRIEFVLAVAVVATLAGARNYAEIARHAADMPQDLLRKIGSEWDWFRLRYRWPSWSVFRSVLAGIGGDDMDRKTGQWLLTHARRDEEGKWEIALDGKVMRGSWNGEDGQLTLFSAMIHREATTIAQVRVPPGTNETTQVKKILEVLDELGIPEGDEVLITLDAAHTCQETAAEIDGRPGLSYLMSVKGNRESLQKAVFAKLAPLTTGNPDDIVRERSRGRIRTWSCWAAEIASGDGIELPGACQVALIRRDVREISGLLLSKEIALMITSRDPSKMTAAGINKATREHWGIENSSHYPRDTVYREDHCQAWRGEAPQVLASLHNLALGLFHLKGVRKIKETTERIAADRTRALHFMAT